MGEQKAVQHPQVENTLTGIRDKTGQQAAQALSWTTDLTVASEKAEPLALDLFFSTVKWSQHISKALLQIKLKAAGVVQMSGCDKRRWLHDTVNNRSSFINSEPNVE